jgi:hypothetical protein
VSGCQCRLPVPASQSYVAASDTSPDARRHSAGRSRREGVRCLRSAHLRKIPTVRRTASHSSVTAPRASILVNSSSRVPAGLSP